jgi:hypothetical protein
MATRVLTTDGQIFVILFVLCVICAILSSWWERRYGNVSGCVGSS